MKELTNLFKILSDETRLRIILLLSEGQLCVCQICGILELSQPKASKHLAKMRDLGFVDVEKKEQFVYYSLNLESKMVSKIIQVLEANALEIEQFKIDREKLNIKENILNKCEI